jgi:hypothetical protein
LRSYASFFGSGNDYPLPAIVCPISGLCIFRILSGNIPTIAIAGHSLLAGFSARRAVALNSATAAHLAGHQPKYTFQSAGPSGG